MTKCTNCRRFGHNTKDCFTPSSPKFDPAKCGKGKKLWKPKTKKDDGAEVAQLAQDIDLEMAFVATNNDVHMSDLNDIEVPLYLWIADTGVTTHITHTRDALTDYVSAKKEILGIGTVPVLAEGHGDLKIRTQVQNKSFVVTLTNVLYIPNMWFNILSIGHLDESSGRAITGKGKIQLLNWSNKPFANRYRLKVMYYLHVETIVPEVSHMIQPKESWQSWHKKFGHIGLDRLKHLYQKDLVQGLDIDEHSPIFDCTACIQAKQAHTPFPKEATQCTELPGELMYMDLWGPHQIEGVAHALPTMVFFFLFLFAPFFAAFLLTVYIALCKPGCAISTADMSLV